ncbi:general odorant-binding protein 69a [Diachasmimorpha longicaudata]|uniref:general odorant-binding protein 69a n=1 Tax=Diachasmimorpha longicaudata TaxID=58733 RepID=UPI0030B8C3BD
MARHMVCCFLIGMAMQALLVSAGRPDFITDDMMAMVADDKARCMSEHGTTEALIDEVNTGALPNNRALTCYMDCLFAAFGVIDEGELEVDMLVGFLPDHMQDAARDLLETCAKQPGADPCDKVFEIAKCVQAKRPDLWFMI